MKVEEKIIAYWAINESIVKILVGAILLFDNSRGTVKKDVDYDMKKDKLYPVVLLAIGSFGLFCSLKLKTGIQKKSLKHIFWWIVYQFVAILFQMYFYAIVWWILKDSLTFQSIWKLLIVLTVAHVIQEVFFLNNILNLLFDINQQQREASNSITECTEESTGSDDKPPPYSDVVGSLV